MPRRAASELYTAHVLPTQAIPHARVFEAGRAVSEALQDSTLPLAGGPGPHAVRGARGGRSQGSLDSVRPGVLTFWRSAQSVCCTVRVTLQGTKSAAIADASAPCSCMLAMQFCKDVSEPIWQSSGTT